MELISENLVRPNDLSVLPMEWGQSEVSSVDVIPFVMNVFLNASRKDQLQNASARGSARAFEPGGVDKEGSAVQYFDAYVAS